MTVKLNKEAAAQTAKEFTALAIQHDLIQASGDEVATAENVIAFFNTIYENLTGESNDN